MWVIVTGSVAVQENKRTLFIRQRNEVVGEQNLLGNGCRRWYDLVVNESPTPRPWSTQPEYGTYDDLRTEPEAWAWEAFR